ncbi:MAG: hypothetical protein AAGK33_10090 [Pseudomonadota bacterium]
MSDASFNRPVTASGTGPTLAYRALFAVLFIFSAFAAVASRLFKARSMPGGESSLSIWQAAKQAAHATAGYAVKY